MPAFEVLDQSALIDLARKRGWLTGAAEAASTVEELAPVDFHSAGVRGTLPAMHVENRGSVHMRIPEALIHGGNFSLIVEDRIYPGGFVHSFWPSPRWTPAGKGRVNYDPGRRQKIEARAASLLGVVAHWGHFFVDALDRLFELQSLGRLDGAFLVGDPNLLNLQPQVDELHAVPQVSGLMRLLGARLEPGNVLPMYRKFDYEVANLTLCTLKSLKPAIPADSLRRLRQRLRQSDEARAAHRFLFVGRADVKKRFIVDQAALVEHLQRRYQAMTIYPEHLTVEQSIGSFAGAERIILPIGSAKFNLVFCRPGTAVVCVTPRGYVAQNSGVTVMMRHLCHALGLPLAFYEVQVAQTLPMLLNSDMIIRETDVAAMVALLDDLA